MASNRKLGVDGLLFTTKSYKDFLVFHGMRLFHSCIGTANPRMIAENELCRSMQKGPFK